MNKRKNLKSDYPYTDNISLPGVNIRKNQKLKSTMSKQNNEPGSNYYIKTNNRTVFFIKAILIYLSIICLIVSIDFLQHIGEMLYIFNLGAIFGIVLLAICVFILSTNVAFFIRKKTIEDYKIVLLANVCFCLISGFCLRIAGYVITNNLGSDFSIVYIYNHAGHGFMLHYDIFNLVINFHEDHFKYHGFTLQINLIMWALGLFLLFCYKNSDRLLALPT